MHRAIISEAIISNAITSEAITSEAITSNAITSEAYKIDYFIIQSNQSIKQTRTMCQPKIYECSTCKEECNEGHICENCWHPTCDHQDCGVMLTSDCAYARRGHYCIPCLDKMSIEYYMAEPEPYQEENEYFEPQ